MDYCDLKSTPDRDGWVKFLRDRLPFSFVEIREVKRNRLYQLDGPVLDYDINRPQETPSHHTYNLWARALSFYAAGKIADAYGLKDVLRGARSVNPIHEIHMGTLGMGDVLTRTRDVGMIWDAVQLERLWMLLNVNRLDCERVAFTNIMQALELIIKAVTVHCNYHRGNGFCFCSGHDLVWLYSDLPSKCQAEFEREAKSYIRQFMKERKKTEQRIHQLKQDEHEADKKAGRLLHTVALRDLVDVIAGKSYLDTSSNEHLTASGQESEDGWIIKTLRDAGNLIDHRYGPLPPLDHSQHAKAMNPFSYDPAVLAAAQSVARFFLEHLFGIVQTTIKQGGYNGPAYD